MCAGGPDENAQAALASTRSAPRTSELHAAGCSRADSAQACALSRGGDIIRGNVLPHTFARFGEFAPPCDVSSQHGMKLGRGGAQEARGQAKFVRGRPRSDGHLSGGVPDGISGHVTGAARGKAQRDAPRALCGSLGF